MTADTLPTPDHGIDGKERDRRFTEWWTRICRDLDARCPGWDRDEPAEKAS
jgi:hypothetical protein